MTRKPSHQSPQPTPRIALTYKRFDAAKKIQTQIQKGHALLSTISTAPFFNEETYTNRQIFNEETYANLQNDYYRWSDFNQALLKSLFNTDEVARDYIGIRLAATGRKDPIEARTSELSSDIQRDTNNLLSVLERLDIYPDTEGDANQSIIPDKTNIVHNRVFIVHGHNPGVKNEVARVLEKLDLEVIILHEQPDEGRTIIEKFEYYANTCTFAVIILTADDNGYPKDDPNGASKRARQNVILELGYFLAKLGRSRVCALLEKDVELPSDYQGMLWKPLGDTSWDHKLAKEIKAAGISVDLNKL